MNDDFAYCSDLHEFGEYLKFHLRRAAGWDKLGDLGSPHIPELSFTFKGSCFSLSVGRLSTLPLELEDLEAEGRFFSLLCGQVCHLCCLTSEENNQLFWSIRWQSAYFLGLKLQFGTQGPHVYLWSHKSISLSTGLRLACWLLFLLNSMLLPFLWTLVLTLTLSWKFTCYILDITFIKHSTRT